MLLLARRSNQKRADEFGNVADHLYRYSANKIYYAVSKVRGKRIWKSLFNFLAEPLEVVVEEFVI